ncbi:hypothetical protein U9M48_039369 [Paspalum notatum var. saurae]|uniref:Ubiquitin-like protease family profile domain-containing protein n=1 Tax=Paspalum notatum var. saurae TaxID=547442 RepID=A0AAQ3XEJ6_PASNO
MKSVDRPPLNPKRITIESSQECFSVDIPRAAAPEGSANPSVAGSRPQHRKRPAVRGGPPTFPPQDDDDDFMPPKKKPNVSVPTKQHRSSPRLSRPDPRGIKKSVKKVVTKKKKVKASPCQRQAVVRKGFSEILDMTLDSIGSRSHLCWLMDKLDPKDMTIRPGPGKELKITKETVCLILGLPCAGGGKPLGVDAAAAADRLRSSLGLTKDEFTISKLQDRLRLGLASKNYDKYFHYDIWMLHRRTFPKRDRYMLCTARENHGLRTPPGSEATRHEDTPGCHGPSAPAPESHAPQPPPSNTKDCHAHADDRRHCDFPRIKDMLSSKIQQLPALERLKFEAKLAAHDQAVEQQIATIKDCLTSIVDKQFDLKDTFYEMVDDVLRAEATNNDETSQPSNDHDHAAQEPCTDSGTQLSPGTQLDTPMTGTQAEIIYERQQHMRRSFEACPDDSDTEAPDDALAAANELMTNLNIAAQGISERTSTSPPAEPGLPKFDVTPQTKASLSLGSQITNCSSPSNEFQPKSMQYGSEVIGGVIQPDNGPVFDETPCGHRSSVPPTTPIANIVKPTRTKNALALCEFLCTRDVEIDRTVMDFGGYTSTCQDVKESFADGASLDSVFMQYFIECVRSDDSANLPSSNTSRLILDTNVRAIINIEELEQHSQNPQTFDPVILQNYLVTTLPSHPGLEGIKTIMVPMLRGGHWSLYVVNTVRLIMNRLNKALQRVRPKSSIPKFGNYKIDLAPNCPTMNPGSNDCGFFVTTYIQFYDYRNASILLFLDPDMSREHRSLLLHYLTFHRNNKSLPLPSDMQRFCHADH